jgi:hypothetical protein
MALNFLKRKDTYRKNVLLYHNPVKKSKSRRASKAYMDEVFKICLKEQSKEQPARENQKAAKENSESLNDIENIVVEKDVSDQSWIKGKERINKLMYEISDLLSSEDYIEQGSKIIMESNGNETQSSESQKLSEQSIPEKNKSQKKVSSKLPLDIQELHTVAAIAKRLSVRSKLEK